MWQPPVGLVPDQPLFHVHRVPIALKAPLECIATLPPFDRGEK